jgi:hypothetical protein
MPIRPENRDRYPHDWAEIRARILQRAGNRCEGSPQYSDCRAENGKPHPITGSTVVLTIAHLDHTPETRDEALLRALCQRCHFAYDREEHQRNAARTRRARKAAGDLFGPEPKGDPDV